MPTILVMSVGGEVEPLATSIRGHKPDLVYFLCSDDVSTTKGSYTRIDEVLKKARFSKENSREYRIKQFDSLDDCYRTALQLIEEIHRCFPEARVIVDYTGGTKSMCAGLVVAALDDGKCEIGLVAGVRRDLEKVADRTEFVRSVQVWHMQTMRQMKIAQVLLSRFDYSGAEKALEEAARALPTSIADLGEKINKWIVLCRAFDAWDRFQHKKASELLKAVKDKWIGQYKAFLGVLVAQRGHGFELVEDLLLNAERRAVQGRYDDAIARLYRACLLYTSPSPRD